MPLKTDSAQVTITVLRDLRAPLFLKDSYNFNTDEERPVNHTIGTVTAVDPDLRVRIEMRNLSLKEHFTFYTYETKPVNHTV